MRVAVFAGGPGIDTDRVSSIASSCDIVIAADSGADVAAACGIMPSKVVGDMDSIDPDTMEFLKGKRVPFEVYPVEKDSPI